MLKTLLNRTLCLLTLHIMIAGIADNNSATAQERIVDRIVAVVGSNIILESELENELRQKEAQNYIPGDNSKCNLLATQVIQKLLLNQAIVDSIEVFPADVEMDLNRRLQFFVQQFGSEEKLEAHFNKSILEIKDDFRDIVRDQMLTEQMQAEIIGNVRITPGEVRRFYNNMPEDEIPMIPSKVEIRKIVNYPKFSETENFRVRQRLNEFRQRIIEGESFTTMAVLYSEDPGSARRGGNLGYISRSDMVPEFSNVVFALRGDRVSPVFETEFGFHIAQVTDRRGDQLQVRHILLRPAATDQAREESREFLDSLATVIRTDTLSFHRAAITHTEHKETRMSGGLVINPHTGGSEFELDQLNPVQFEAVRDMKVGEIRGPIESRDQQGRTFYKLLYLEKQTPPHRANLEDDYAFLKEMALNDKKYRIFERWVLEKKDNTYIRIDDAYKNCDLSLTNW